MKLKLVLDNNGQYKELEEIDVEEYFEELWELNLKQLIEEYENNKTNGEVIKMKKKEDLMKVFKEANNEGSQFIFIGIDAVGVKEVICIPKESFGKKLIFYKDSYTDDLTHKHNEDVRITKINHGDLEVLSKMV